MHEPVLSEEVLKYLDPKPGYKVLDATIGSAGHSEAILERISPGGFLLGLDQDIDATQRAALRLSRFQNHFSIVEENFRNLDKVLKQFPKLVFDCALLDAGFSLDQVVSSGRGFSFRSDEPLDMRMSLKLTVNAADLVNNLPETELADIFWKYGEERKSRRYAKAIVEVRRRKQIQTSLELAAIIESSGGGRRYGKMHPATQVFQALRIRVNDELAALEEALPKILASLKSGGRLAVITFHSLEARIVKNLFRGWQKDGLAVLLAKKAILPQREEVLRNPKSRSAQLRVLMKT